MIPGTNQPAAQQIAATPDGWTPPGGLPSHKQLTYCKEAITVLLLVLALPWLLVKLATRPGDVIGGVKAA